MRHRASAIILQNDSLLLIKRHRENDSYYVLPGGGIEVGETPHQAILREMKEEAGVTVEAMSTLAEIPLPDVSQHMHCLLCRIVPADQNPTWQETHKQSPGNSYAFVWVALSEVDSLDLRPKEIKQLLADLSA